MTTKSDRHADEYIQLPEEIDQFRRDDYVTLHGF
jgi:hypothetical protein